MTLFGGELKLALDELLNGSKDWLTMCFYPILSKPNKSPVVLLRKMQYRIKSMQTPFYEWQKKKKEENKHILNNWK